MLILPWLLIASLDLLGSYRQGDGSPVYNSFGQLSGVSTDTGMQASYTYDAMGRRASKTVNGVEKRHLWNGDRISAEADANDAITDTYFQLGSLSAHKTGDEFYYYIYDGHGNVAGMKDGYESGDATAMYNYDTFGNPLSDPMLTNPFRYCNEYYDAETDMIYLRNRYYDPGIGRFITEDPVKDGMNWYAYCNNNPVMFVDPSGLKAKGEVFGYRGGNYSDVVALQNKLNELGYVGADGKPLSVDGDFGRNTDYAVRNYQRDNGLTVDGLVGDITWTSFGFKNNALVSNHNVYSGTIKGVYYRTTVMPSYLLSDLSPDEYILVAPAQMLVTSEKAAEQIKMKEKELMDSVISSAMMSGGIKVDIKQINQVANQMGLSKTARRAFGDYVESLKQISGKPGNANFTWKELVEIAKEFLGE